MGSRNVPDRNRVFFGIPNVDFNTEIDYARDEAIKDLERKNQELIDQLQTFVPAAEVAGPTIIGGLVIESTRPAGLPIDGTLIGTGIYAVASATDNVKTDALYDTAGDLGLGAGVFVGMRVQLEATGTSTIEIIAYNPATTAVTSLGFPITLGIATPTNTWYQMKVVAGSLYIRNVLELSTYGNTYRWNISTGWTTVSGGQATGPMSSMLIGTDEYLVLTANISSTRVVGIIDPATPDTMTAATTAISAGHFVFAKNDSVWTSDGKYSTAATSMILATKVAGMSYANEFRNLGADIDFDTGYLCVATKYGSPATYAIIAYDPTNGLAYVSANIFTITGLAADGEPITHIKLMTNNGLFAMFGFVQDDFYGSPGTYELPSIWLSDGSTTTEVYTEVTSLTKDSFVGGSFTSDGTNSVLAVNYGQEISASVRVSTIDVQIIPAP